MYTIMLFIFSNPLTLVMIIAGCVAAYKLHHGKLDQESSIRWILTLLCMLAVTELSHRLFLLYGLRTQVDALTSTTKDLATRVGSIHHDVSAFLGQGTSVEFINIEQDIWKRAEAMLNGAGEGAIIYDTTSVRNDLDYEEALEAQRLKGADVYRIVCAPEDSNLGDFIVVPPIQAQSQGGTYTVRHVPYPLPFDCLIVRSRDAIGAIIGIRTGDDHVSAYCAALHTRSNEITEELSQSVRHVYGKLSADHRSELQAQSTTCRMCIQMPAP